MRLPSHPFEAEVMESTALIQAEWISESLGERT